MSKNKFSISAALVTGLIAAGLLISGCGKQGATPASLGDKEEITVNGAGATFPYPIYAKWADKYHSIAKVRINYQSIGSGGGVQQIQKSTVDFGASDAPLTIDELKKSGLVQFPMIMGGVVPVINLSGIDKGQISLSPDTLAGIFLGTIKKWNDTVIAKDNPGVKLPDKAITVVHRADGSGTTWIFTNYLDKVSKNWHSKCGFGKAVNWPVGIGGKGNEGVAAYVQRVDGSIGYVEYAYALQNKMTYVKLKNQAGKSVEPSIETFQAAAASADWANAPGYYVVLTNQPGEASWPITGASYIIIHKDQKNTATAKAMLDFFAWSYGHGADQAKELNYVPMPDNVAKMVQSSWKKDIVSGGKAIWK